MNWNNPTLSSTKADVLTDLKARDVDAYTWAESPTNPPTGAKRWVSASNKIQEWNGSSWIDKVLALESGGTGSSNASGARTSLGLGTMATQNSNAIAVSGGTISGLTSLGVAGNLTSTGILTMGSGPTTVTQSDGKVLETAIADGTLLARNAGNENITGVWSFLSSPSIANTEPVLSFYDTDGGTDAKYWRIYANGTALVIQTINDALNTTASVLEAYRSGTTITSASLTGNAIALNGNTTVTGSEVVTGSLQVNGVVLAGDGTAPSNPAFAFVSSPDTGLMLSGGTLQLRVDSVLGMTFDEVTGIVRIGVNGEFQNSLIPYGSGGYDLGSSGQKWRDVYATNGTIITSDVRHKRNHGELDSALEKVRSVTPFIASWIHGPDDLRFPAFSAQNVKEVIDEDYRTEIVKVDNFNGHCMYQDRMIPILWAAVKELDAEVQRLRTN